MTLARLSVDSEFVLLFSSSLSLAFRLFPLVAKTISLFSSCCSVLSCGVFELVASAPDDTVPRICYFRIIFKTTTFKILISSFKGRFIDYIYIQLISSILIILLLYEKIGLSLLS